MGEFEEKLNAILGDPAAMGQIMALAQSLGRPAGPAPPEPSPPQAPLDVPDSPAAPEASNPPEGPLPDALGSIDPKLLQLGMRLFREYQGDENRNAALLAALRPFLREERRPRLDRALQLARLSRVIRVAFQTMGRGEEDHV